MRSDGQYMYLSDSQTEPLFPPQPYSGTSSTFFRPECPWLSPTDEDDKLECGDGTLCYPVTDLAGWSCCNDHEGRAKCPLNYPYMCAQEDGCAGGQDYCCETSCNYYGGYRLCNGQGPDLGK